MEILHYLVSLYIRNDFSRQDTTGHFSILRERSVTDLTEIQTESIVNEISD